MDPKKLEQAIAKVYDDWYGMMPASFAGRTLKEFVAEVLSRANAPSPAPAPRPPISRPELVQLTASILQGRSTSNVAGSARNAVDLATAALEEIGRTMASRERPSA